MAGGEGNNAGVSPHAPQAWFLLSGDEEKSALNHPWPDARDGDVQFVVDDALRTLRREELLGLYAEMTEKMLAVFRELIPPGGWIYALDYHHTNYRLIPHAPAESLWPVTVYPDGDPEHWFVPSDSRFVYSASYTVNVTEGRPPIEVETYELRGRELIDAVERNLPKLFQLARRVPVTEQP
ncbi:DUF2716 domain-containing protein [Pyxidicoccus parkwayensis]|uniref:DUF2716 domain-containing protein n=1 Tax=Pyxidicoccus parkwayensis TaxID=2813578 RepID=A0ABX7P785_9BACT|nr:DUF2716 domain-containing protein [Pyxidicoccus parkwaysis]QSQ26348.1 DUF2716 domain-containing protein [Pyxidicoccus parkwaysis]